MSIDFFKSCKKFSDPEDKRKTLLLHPIYKLIVYRGYVDKNFLPHGHGIQYRCKLSHKNKKLLSINNVDYYIGYKLRAGQWKYGKMNGQGYQYFKNNLLYRGIFEDDKPHGKGTFYKNNKVDQEGSWYNGNISDGYGMIFYPDGSRYKGYAINKLKNGNGILYDDHGNEIKCGYWINDIFIENINIQNE